MAVTNLYGWVGAYCYCQAGMHVHEGLLLASALCAFVRHLIETGHHGMPGVGRKVSPAAQERWAMLTAAIDLGVALATLFVFRVDELYLLWFLAAGLACLALPELVSRCNALAPKADQAFYVAVHSAGHLLIYHVWNAVAARTWQLVSQRYPAC